MKKKVKPLSTHLKNDVEYLEVAVTSAPTPKERTRARRRLKQLRKK